MIKFNHNNSGTIEATGLTSNEAVELFVQSIEEYRKNCKYTPTDTQKVAILIAVTRVINSQILGVILEDIRGKEFNATSEVIEYLYQTLKGAAYYSLAALCIKHTEE